MIPEKYITIRIRENVHIKCKAAARDKNMRLNDWMEEILEKHFKEENAKHQNSNN